MFDLYKKLELSDVYTNQQQLLTMLMSLFQVLFVSLARFMHD